MGDATLRLLVLLCALAPAAAPALAADVPLGRMFFTPAQRAQLDVARTQRARTTLAMDKAEELAAAPVPQSLTYDGVVRRSDGKSTVFLNNRPVHDKEPVGGVIVGRVRPDGGVSLQMPQTGHSIDLKPGQSVELLSGQIEEAYGRSKPAAQPEARPEARPAAKPVATADRARDERDREEKEQQRVDEAVARALKERAGARPDAPTPAESLR